MRNPSNIYGVGVGWKATPSCSASLQAQIPPFRLCECQVFRKLDTVYHRSVCFSKCPLVSSIVDKCNCPHFTGENTGVWRQLLPVGWGIEGSSEQPSIGAWGQYLWYSGLS